jgi:uncharacterized protein (TIGR02646 family)
MRTIIKRPTPKALTEWRQPRLAGNKGPGMECTYEELRRDQDVLRAVEDGLFVEQGGICAYTGHPLELGVGEGDGTSARRVGFHIEHLKSQERCRNLNGADYGEDASYINMVACWPPPNCGYQLPYGAHEKASWPTPAEDHLFVSPLATSCGQRFRFDRKGGIEPASPDDEAARTTIRRLGLDNAELKALRRSTIDGELRGIGLRDARRSLQRLRDDAGRLDAGEDVRLAAYCFAVEQALEREIRKLEGIRRSRRTQG